MAKRDTANERTVKLTDEALKIYDSWPHMEKSKRVSEAIEKADREQGNTLIQRIEELERKVQKLERRLKE